MNTIDNSKISSEDISLGLLLDTLAGAKDLPLVFHYDGRPVKAGYHVTEVKAGHFSALDCGANYESWHETFIQLWDIPQEDERRFMPCSKFLGIIGKVAAQVPFDANAKMTFEVSDGNRPIALYRASAIEVSGDIVRVLLAPRPASCKPRDRWLEQQQNPVAACCGASQTGSACCG